MLPREFYLPENLRNTEPTTPEGTDLAIWSWENDKGQPRAIAFQGKRQKPLWNYRFQNERDRKVRIHLTTVLRKSHLADKAKGKKARKLFIHEFKAGDILISVWGYDQTNIDFFEVTKTTIKTITLRPVGQTVADSTRGQDYVAPDTKRILGDTFTRRVTPYGRVKIDDVRGASKWDGKPRSQTASGWGH